jgi:hypothetical protein
MRVLALVLALSAIPSGVRAADTPVQVVASADGVRHSIAREATRMVNHSAVVQPQPAPSRRWVARHPVAFGILIGLAGGIAVGASQPYEGQKNFGPCIALGAGGRRWHGRGTAALIAWAGR